MFMRLVLEELARVQGYGNIKSMTNIQDYNMILTFVNQGLMRRGFFYIHLEVVKRIAELFGVTSRFIISMLRYERINDERLI